MSNQTVKPTFAMLLPFGGRYVHPYWAVSLAAIRWPSNSSHVILHSMHMQRDLARNTLVERALDMDAQFIFFADDDTMPEGNVITKLHLALSTADDDVVAAGGIYTSKCYPSEPYCYTSLDSAPHWKWKAGDVFPCWGLGTGCLMIKASAFAKIPKPWFRDIDSLEDVGDDPSLKIHPSVGEFKMTDDMYFFNKCSQAGLKVLAHGGVLPVHWDQDGNPFTLPQDSYPLKGLNKPLWYGAFGIGEGNLIAPERRIELPDGFLSQEEANELHSLARDKTVLEMGAFKGRSTVCMALTATSVTSVDWHRGDSSLLEKYGDTEVEYRHNIRNYPNVTPIIGRFEDEIPKLAGQTFDLVYVDGAHDKESVIRDIGYALSFKPAVMAVHDCGLFEVDQALKEMGLTPTRVINTLGIFELDTPAQAA